VVTVATAAFVSLIAGMAGMAGGWFSLWLCRFQARATAMLALGAGYLIGGAFFGMLPGAFAQPSLGALCLAGGFFGFMLIQQLCALARRGVETSVRTSPETAWAATVGMGLHAFFEGAMLGLALQGGHELQVVAAVALLLHKLPEGFSLAGIVLTATGSPRRSLLATGLVGLAMVAGALVGTLWSRVALIPYGALSGLVAGSFLYAGAVEMLPGLLRKERLTPWLALLGALLAHATTLL
jgi:zinc transporter ZupT